MTLAVAREVGSGPLVVLLHGFPETPACWRFQVEPLAAAGYRVVVPWLRGYGPSTGPAEPDGYTADLLAGDVAELITRYSGDEPAVVIGHDWGAAVTWATAELHPERVRAIAALSVPFTARSRRPPLERLAEVFGDTFFYMLYFQRPEAEAELGADLRRFLLATYAGWSGSADPAGADAVTDAAPEGDAPARSGLLAHLPAGTRLPDYVDAGTLDEAVATFRDGGLRGPLNYYRAMDLTWHRVPEYGVAPVRCPVLFLAGEADPVLAFTPTRAMAPPLVADLRATVLLPGVGHWLQQEAPQRVTEELLGFLASL